MTRLVLLPGLGTTARLFDPQRSALLRAIVDWRPRADPPCRIRAIHGADDRLILVTP
jgi:hypothetical protein